VRHLLAVAVLGVIGWQFQAVGHREGVSTAALEQQQPQQPGQFGAFLYGRDCAWCHGPAGEGTPRGTPLIDVGAASASFYLTSGRMPINDPEQPVRRRDPIYEPAEIDALVAHVAGFGTGPPVPVVDPDAGDAAAGGVLYRRPRSQCHGSTGVGTALTFGVIAPSVHHSTPTQVAESMIVGPGAMPAFAPDVFGPEDVANITAHVLYLQDPVDRGGLPLARAGRIDEMLVAWGIGIVTILIGLRLIARRG
jgi:ubiquinol-cytochrome c reductase cytochrome c subunit